MLKNISGIEKLENIEIKQKRKGEEFIKFIEERREYLDDIRDHYCFHAFSVDFGDQEIQLEYTNGRYMKCADSEGRIYLEETIPEEIPSEDLVDIIDDLFQKEPLSALLKILEFPDWRELSYLVDTQKARPPRNLREFLRECLEWSVLLGYADKNRKVILIKDGLLRNKIFKRIHGDPDCAYRKLQAKVQEICLNNENLIVGITKNSKLRQLAYKYLEKTQTFLSKKPFVIRVGNQEEMMEISYTYDLYREGEVVFGNNLYLARFKQGIETQIFTLEIPDFAEENWDGVPQDRKRKFSENSYAYIIGLIAGLPKRTLPKRFNGAPEPLAQAHEYAHTKEITAKVIERTIRQNISTKEKENNV